MIGEDQAKGYKKDISDLESSELEQKEETQDEFEQRKKRALELIGRTEDIQLRSPPDKEEIAEIAKNAMNNTDAMRQHEEKVLAHDIMILRMQNDKIINALNEQTKTIAALKGEVEKLKWRTQQ